MEINNSFLVGLGEWGNSYNATSTIPVYSEWAISVVSPCLPYSHHGSKKGRWGWRIRQVWDSVQFSHSVLSDSLQSYGLQHARLPCPSPTPGACSNSCPSSQWCHPAISSSVVPFSFCFQYFPVSGSLPVSQFFPSGSQCIGVSASTSVLPTNIQDWFPLGLTV